MSNYSWHIDWTAEKDATIRNMRAAGKAWTVIASHLGCSSYALIWHAKKIGAWTPPRVGVAALTERDLAGEPPLPAGHPIAWRELTLHGEGYGL